jgi:hypothetical protein
VTEFPLQQTEVRRLRLKRARCQSLALQLFSSSSAVSSRESREFVEVRLRHFNRFAFQCRLKLFKNLGKDWRANGVLGRQRICWEFRANLAERQTWKPENCVVEQQFHL